VPHSLVKCTQTGEDVAILPSSLQGKVNCSGKAQEQRYNSFFDIGKASQLFSQSFGDPTSFQGLVGSIKSSRYIERAQRSEQRRRDWLRELVRWSQQPLDELAQDVAVASYVVSLDGDYISQQLQSPLVVCKSGREVDLLHHVAERLRNMLLDPPAKVGAEMLVSSSSRAATSYTVSATASLKVNPARSLTERGLLGSEVRVVPNAGHAVTAQAVATTGDPRGGDAPVSVLSAERHSSNDDSMSSGGQLSLTVPIVVISEAQMMSQQQRSALVSSCYTLFQCRVVFIVPRLDPHALSLKLRDEKSIYQDKKV